MRRQAWRRSDGFEAVASDCMLRRGAGSPCIELRLTGPNASKISAEIMANFLGHLYGGAAVSAAGALAIGNLEWAEADYIQALFLLGLVGGLLPDIDADNSKPVRAFFSLLAVALAYLVTFSLMGDLPLAKLALIWGAVFVLIRFALFELFTRFTVHRGIWHSWLAAAFAALAVANVAHHLAGLSAWESWLAGLFLGLGYLTHLLLDEITSVDLLNNRMRRSFGTALKPFSIASPAASVMMFLGTLALGYLSPSVEPVIAAVNRLQSDGFPFSSGDLQECGFRVLPSSCAWVHENGDAFLPRATTLAIQGAAVSWCPEAASEAGKPIRLRRSA